MNEVPSEREESHDTDTTVTKEQSQHFEPSIASDESSFLPSQAAFSSTPATARISRTQDSFASETSDDPSWTASIESPLVRLDREIREFSKDDDISLLPSSSKQISSLRFDKPAPPDNPGQGERTIHTARPDKGKGKEADPLLRNVLRHNLHSMSDASATISPFRYRGKLQTPIPPKKNPYLPPNKDPAEWKGLVDLRDLSIVTTPRSRHQRTRTPALRRDPTTPAKESDDEDSFDGLPPGMSPPVMMSPARPPRSSAELGLMNLGQTPTREASARITRDLVRDIQYKSGRPAGHTSGHGYSGTESSTSTMPTPPSLSRYNRTDTTDSIVIDSSLESMMMRVGIRMSSKPATVSTPGLRIRSKGAQASSIPLPQTVDDTVTVPAPAPMTLVNHPDDHPDDSHDDLHAHPDIDSDSDSDSLDEVNNTAYPSAAFMMASAQSSHDDSFGSSSSHSGDSLTTGDDVDLGLPVHPFAMGVEDTGFDSFDDEGVTRKDGPREETLFGVLPQQRIRVAQEHRLERGQGQVRLRMLGEDLLQDTIGFGAQIAMRGTVEESPTPAPPVGGLR